MTLLECMSSILDKLKDDESRRDRLEFSTERLPEIKEETDYLNEKMGLSPIQSVLFSVLLQKSTNCRCSMEDVADYMGMNYVKLLTYDKELEDLWNKWLIRRRGSELKVPFEVIEQLRENKPYKKPKTAGLTTKMIMTRMSNLFKMIKDGVISTQQMMKEADEIMYNNQETSVGRTIKKYLVKDDQYTYNWKERYLLFLLIHFYDNKNDDMISWPDLSDYFQDSDDYEELEDLYTKGNLQLQKDGIIEYTEDDGLFEKEFFHIKDAVKIEILEDNGGLHKKMPFVCDIEPQEIPAKDMFYNEPERGQIETLEGLLSQGKLNQIYESLRAKGLRTGFTCLFYGAPGTGKTETVYQLARKTGRKIIVADVSKLKNCYVGETEKNVKALFMDYRRACYGEDVTPILLFNEADAIFGVRKENARNAVDKMENSVQNIILQEMENLSGILIATTNLSENLDKAFERRFLYKIKFNKPSLQAKENIWKAMIPDLTPPEAAALASEYDFSGGQIENIVRKREIQAILLGRDPDFEHIKSYCSEEMIETDNPFRMRIGF